MNIHLTQRCLALPKRSDEIPIQVIWAVRPPTTPTISSMRGDYGGD
nr:unnamed protein product [Callosobruchus analis]